MAIAAGAGGLALLQPVPPAGDRSRFPAPGWWFSPIVAGAPPEHIGCDLRAVSALDERQVWIAGALRFVARSGDGGYTWTRERVVQKSKRPNDSPYTVPPPTAPAEPNAPIPSQGASKGPTGAFLEVIEGTAHAATPSEGPSVPPAVSPENLPGAGVADQAARATGTPDFVALDVSGEPALLGAIVADNGAFYTNVGLRGSWFEGDAVDSGLTPAFRPLTYPFRAAQIRKTSWAVVQSDGVIGSRDSGHDRLSRPWPTSSSTPPGDFVAVSLIPGQLLFGVDDAGVLQRDPLTPSEAAERVGLLPRHDDVRGLFFVDTDHGWAIGAGGLILATSDGGTKWAVQRDDGPAAPALRSAFFLGDRRHGWAVGDRGIVLGSSDGGARWTTLVEPRAAEAAGVVPDVAPPVRLPAPWYWLSLLAFGLLVAPAMRAKAQEDAPPEETVADRFVSDRPLEDPARDRLDLNGVALGLSRFLRNEGTLAPLTVAVTGEWGSGKSSLMNLLRTDLVRFGFRPVQFNAWHHQKEEHMLAALLQAIRLQAVPGWLSVDGLRFRLRLLVARRWRFWLALGATAFVLALSIAFETVHGRRDLSALDRAWKLVIDVAGKVRHGNLDAALQALGAKGSSLGIVASLLALFETVRRGVRAFGVDPGALLAGLSGASKASALSAKTSFRQRFAGELRDVTSALGVRSMIIFIDDLDRCRPDQVVETLEAVNFVVSSGDCFVILGMAPERVIPCIALSFKEVAAEMGAQPAPAALGKGPHAKTARQKRARFAREYLDKLINIEVPVPTPSPTQAERLLLDRDREPPPKGGDADAAPAPAPLWFRAASILVTVVARHGRLVPTLLSGAAIVALIALGAATGVRLGQTEESASAPPVAAPETGAPAAGVRVGGDGARPSAGATPAHQFQRPDRTGQRPEVLGTATMANATPEIVLLALALFIGIIVWIAVNRRPDPVVRDSETFTRALAIWNDVVFSKRPTPRALKRFLNRVRFLAMGERTASGRPSLMERLRAGHSDPLAGRDATGIPAGPTEIRDENLVALAALHEIAGEQIGETIAEDLPALLAHEKVGKAWEAHAAAFSVSVDELRAAATIYARRAPTVRAN